jgi:HpiC1 cyclase
MLNYRGLACAAVAAGILIAGSGTASATVNLIKDSSFEKPAVPVGGYELFSLGQTFDGWKVVGARGDVGPCSGKYRSDGITFNAKAGAQWMDLTGLSNTRTGIAQSFATKPGTKYHLTFWVGNVYDPGGIFGVRSTVKVYVNNILRLTATNSIRPSGRTQAWKEFTLTIKAASSHTMISFINGDPGSDNSNGLDAIQLS